jgi:hypothetical protein
LEPQLDKTLYKKKNSVLRELKKLNYPNINEPIVGNELNRTFSKKEVQMEKKHKKKCLPSLAIKKYKARPR